MDIYKRYHAGHGGSAPGTPTSTSRKAAQQVQTQTLAALQTHSPRSSFTSSSCPSTANVSQAQAQNYGQVQGHGPSRSPPPTPPQAQSMTEHLNNLKNTSYISSSSNYSTEQVSTAVVTTVEKTNTFAQSLTVSTNSIPPESMRSSLSPSSRAEQEQKRQVLITSLFPRSVTLQDTTGIAGISFPAVSNEGHTHKQEAPIAPIAPDFDMGGLSITGHAVPLRAAQTEADRRYVAELLDTAEEIEEEGTEPDSDRENDGTNENDR